MILAALIYPNLYEKRVIKANIIPNINIYRSLIRYIKMGVLQSRVVQRFLERKIIMTANM
jgi:hypothetical protein